MLVTKDHLMPAPVMLTVREDDGDRRANVALIWHCTSSCGMYEFGGWAENPLLKATMRESASSMSRFILCVIVCVFAPAETDERGVRSEGGVAWAKRERESVRARRDAPVCCVVCLHAHRALFLFTPLSVLAVSRPTFAISRRCHSSGLQKKNIKRHARGMHPKHHTAFRYAAKMSVQDNSGLSSPTKSSVPYSIFPNVPVPGVLLLPGGPSPHRVNAGGVPLTERSDAVHFVLRLSKKLRSASRGYPPSNHTVVAWTVCKALLVSPLHVMGIKQDSHAALARACPRTAKLVREMLGAVCEARARHSYSPSEAMQVMTTILCMDGKQGVAAAMHDRFASQTRPTLTLNRTDSAKELRARLSQLLQEEEDAMTESAADEYARKTTNLVWMVQCDLAACERMRRGKA